MSNIFQNPTKSIPRSVDGQTVRVPMDELQIGGRKDHIPASGKADSMAISHVGSKG